MSTSSNRAGSGGHQRKISFPLDAIFQSAIQDSDNIELWRVLGCGSLKLDIDRTNHVGLTPLHQSVLNNNLDGGKMLLCRGADANAADINGYTPLHTASACGYLHLVSLLIMFGADVFSLTKEGDLAIDLAKDTPVSSLLHKHMVKTSHRGTYRRSLICYLMKEYLILFLKLLTFFYICAANLLEQLWNFICITLQKKKTKKDITDGFKKE